MTDSFQTKGFRSKNECDYLRAVFVGNYVEVYRHDATQEPTLPIEHHYTTEEFWQMIKEEGWIEEQ